MEVIRLLQWQQLGLVDLLQAFRNRGIELWLLLFPPLENACHVVVLAVALTNKELQVACLSVQLLVTKY